MAEPDNVVSMLERIVGARRDSVDTQADDGADEREDSGFDEGSRSATMGRMNDEITRPELDAKLELIETRMDARAQRVEHSVDLMSEKIDALARLTERDISETHEARREARSLRTQIMGMGIAVMVAVVAAGIAVIIGFAQLVPALAGNAQAQASAKDDLTTTTRSNPAKK